MKNKLPEQGGTHNKLPKSKALKEPFFIFELRVSCTGPWG